MRDDARETASYDTVAKIQQCGIYTTVWRKCNSIAYPVLSHRVYPCFSRNGAIIHQYRTYAPLPKSTRSRQKRDATPRKFFCQIFHCSTLTFYYFPLPPTLLILFVSLTTPICASYFASLCFFPLDYPPWPHTLPYIAPGVRGIPCSTLHSPLLGDISQGNFRIIHYVF